MASIIRYETMTLDELYKEAFHTNNELALALFDHIDGQYDSGYEEGHDDGWRDAEEFYSTMEAI